MKGRLLLDTSAWTRLDHPTLAEARRAEVATVAERGGLVVCLPFLLEAGYSARGAAEHEALFEDLLSSPRVFIDVVVEDRAVEAQRQLARAGHHRLPPADLLIAVLADHHRLGVLHYDAHFDLITSKCDLSFESEWLSPPGTL